MKFKHPKKDVEGCAAKIGMGVSPCNNLSVVVWKYEGFYLIVVHWRKGSSLPEENNDVSMQPWYSVKYTKAIPRLIVEEVSIYHIKLICKRAFPNFKWSFAHYQDTSH